MAESRSDRAGIVVSTLCAIHCGAAAALAGASGWLGVVMDEPAELVFVFAAAVIAVLALARGFRRHRSATPGIVGMLGLAALIAARVGVPDTAEVAVSIVGASGLIGAHLLNLRAQRACDACCARVDLAA